MDRHKAYVSRLIDPEDGSKLSERGKLYADESWLTNRNIDLGDFQGRVSFYTDKDSTIGHEVFPVDEASFVELGFYL